MIPLGVTHVLTDLIYPLALLVSLPLFPWPFFPCFGLVENYDHRCLSLTTALSVTQNFLCKAVLPGTAPALLAPLKEGKAVFAPAPV